MSLLKNGVATIVLGAQWGDEGKGKLSDILCAEAEVCARCQVREETSWGNLWLFF
jgi:adenylosuccinate synthase